jgi:hypothetical protein
LNDTTGAARWAPFATKEIEGVSLPKLENSSDFPRDYVLMRLASELPQWDNSPIGTDGLKVGEAIVLAGYYPGYILQGFEKDIGIRYQKAGRCQMIKQASGACFWHACSTLKGGSGAPMFVVRTIDGVKKVRFVGLHIANAIEGGLCGADPDFSGLLNSAVRIPVDDLKGFVQ